MDKTLIAIGQAYQDISEKRELSASEMLLMVRTNKLKDSDPVSVLSRLHIGEAFTVPNVESVLFIKKSVSKNIKSEIMGVYNNVNIWTIVSNAGESVELYFLKNDAVFKSVHHETTISQPKTIGDLNFKEFFTK